MTAPIIPNIPPPSPPYSPSPVPDEQIAPGAVRLIPDYAGFERHKSVNSRKSRPAWARNEYALMQHVLSPGMIRRWKIAYFYWLRNWAAREIAAELAMSTQAVKDVLRRLKGR